MNKTNIISWSRNCHFDGLIAVKESKGKRWNTALNYIESIDDFNIDDMSHELAWKRILKTINSMTDEQLLKLNHMKNNRL